MNVAIFTDNDFDKVNGVTTTLRAVLRYAPAGVSPCIYTASEFGDEGPGYFAPPSIGMGIPYYREMRVYLPRLRQYLRRIESDRIDLIHYTTPGPVGAAAMCVAWRAGLAMVGSFHTDLAAYTALLSGSRLLATLMAQHLRWTYGRCDRVLVPSESTRDLLVAGRTDPRKIVLWRRVLMRICFRRRSAPLRSATAGEFASGAPRSSMSGASPAKRVWASWAPYSQRCIAVVSSTAWCSSATGPIAANCRRLAGRGVYRHAASC
jgi:hypothetical protein